MIKVLIVDDQQLLLDLLEHMLSSDGDIQVVGKAIDGNQAIKCAKELNPDVILMDLLMPNCNGIKATKIIKTANKEIKILVLTTSTVGEDVKEALASGADGYLLKNIKKENLILAIKSVFLNMHIIDDEVSDFTRQTPIKPEAGNGKTIDIDGTKVILSERELTIIKMIAEGKSTSEMAQAVFVAEGRLRNIITQILSKLMLKDRTQVAIFAIKNSLA